MLESLRSYTLWADSMIWNTVQTLSDNGFRANFGENLGRIEKRYVHMQLD